MRALLTCLLATATLAACGDASPADTDPADTAATTLPDAAPAAQTDPADTAGPDADATASDRGLTDEQCRTVIGPKVTAEPMRLVAEQTFAVSSAMHGDGCFLTAVDPVSLDDSERIMVTDGAEDGVYPYDYTVTDATGSATTTLAADGVPIQPDHHLRPVAVSFPDLNADGTRDVLVVHDDCHPALAWTAFDDGWVHAPSLDGDYGIPACTVAEATDAYSTQMNETVSP